MTELSSDDFAYIQTFLRTYAGVEVGDSQRALFATRVSSLAAHEKCASAAELVQRLRSARDAEFTRKIADLLLNHETSFFRHPRSFDLLRKHILPAMLEANAQKRRLTIWSAACSTGQEPYSIAILLREHFPQLDSWHVRIVANDISDSVLNRARSGEFSQLEVNRGMPAKLLVRYFSQSGAVWKIRSDIRESISFSQFSLTGDWPGLADIDIVLVRNVLLYFSADTRGAVFKKLARVLRPGGFLLVGTAEPVFEVPGPFSMRDGSGHLYYERDE